MNDELIVGEVATLTLRFVNAAQALADPTAITLTITAPDSTVTVVNTAGLTHVSTGVYSYNLTLSQAGVWAYEADGTGTVPADALGYLSVVAANAPRLRTGPCSDWCSVDDVTAIPAYSADVVPAIMRMIPVASTMLYARSGQQFSGICNATVRPSRRPEGSIPWPSSGPWMSSWQTDWGSGSCWTPGNVFGGCSCGTPPRVDLGYYPIRQIAEVKIDGTILTPTAYRLDDHRWLTRTDGNGWPLCQDLSQPDTALGTFQVKLLHGQDPGPDGVLAAAVLAGELALAYTANGACRLPKRIVTITRQGQTQQLFDPTSLMNDGLFGIFEIDSFLGGVNPHRLTRRATISSPDTRRTVTRAGW